MTDQERHWMQAHPIERPIPGWFDNVGLLLCGIFAVLLLLAIAAQAGLIR